MKADDPRACRWCGDPLPERASGQRGRPRVVHEGTCRRLLRNAQKLDARCALFRAAHRVDRSDVALAAPCEYAVDTDDLADGFQIDSGWDGRPIPPGVLEAWEQALRTQRQVDLHEEEEMRVEVDAALIAFRALPEPERKALLRAAVARRRARAAIRDAVL